MARKPGKDGAEQDAATTDDQTGAAAAPGDVPSPPEPVSISTADAYGTVLSLVSLLMRVMTPNARLERTAGDERDERVLKEIRKQLRAANNPVVSPGEQAGKKAQGLTDERMALGIIRTEFNRACTRASRQPFTLARDRELEQTLWRVVTTYFRRVPEAQFASMQAAFSEVRDRRINEPGFDKGAGDWLIPEPNWEAKPGQKKNRPTTPALVAGELLEAFCTHSGLQSSAGFSTSSTAEHARKLDLIRWERLKHYDACGTFLAALFGAPITEAPLASLRISMLCTEAQEAASAKAVPEDDPQDVALVEAYIGRKIEPVSPTVAGILREHARRDTRYRALTRREYRRVQKDFREYMIELGAPDNEETKESANRLARRYVPYFIGQIPDKKPAK